MVIYKTTNLVNGKQYIGKDKNNNPNYIGSGILLQKAIKKYGRSNFKKEILEECNSDEILSKREEYWLNYYDAGNNPNFYNMHNYSHGGLKSENLSEETRKKLGDANRGRKYSESHRKRISESRRGIKFSDETKQKLRDHNLGKKMSDETKQKLRELLSGEKSPSFKGYILCVDGEYKGHRKTRQEWASLLGVYVGHVSNHLYGKKYKKGIKGNFLKWEHEL
jgi:group I intron endonuclease